MKETKVGMAEATQAEMELRLQEVVKMVLAGVRHGAIVRQCEARWGIKQSQAGVLLRRAKARIAKEGKVKFDVELAKAGARLEDQYLKADARGDHRGAAAIVEKIIALYGLAAPRKTEVSGPEGGPIVVAGALKQLEDEIVAAAIARAEAETED